MWGELSDSAPSLHLHREIHNATDRERQGDESVIPLTRLDVGPGEDNYRGAKPIMFLSS